MSRTQDDEIKYTSIDDLINKINDIYTQRYAVGYSFSHSITQDEEIDYSNDIKPIYDKLEYMKNNKANVVKLYGGSLSSCTTVCTTPSTYQTLREPCLSDSICETDDIIGPDLINSMLDNANAIYNQCGCNSNVSNASICSSHTYITYGSDSYTTICDNCNHCANCTVEGCGTVDCNNAYTCGSNKCSCQSVWCDDDCCDGDCCNSDCDCDSHVCTECECWGEEGLDTNK